MEIIICKHLLLMQLVSFVFPCLGMSSDSEDKRRLHVDGVNEQDRLIGNRDIKRSHTYLVHCWVTLTSTSTLTLILVPSL